MGESYFSHHQNLFLILSYSQSKSGCRPLGLHPTAKGEAPFPSWTRGWEPLHFGVGREFCYHQASSLRKELGPEEEVTGTGPWILLSSFKTDTCCHLVPITASVHWGSPTEAPRWKTEAEALCAWSPENVPSISQLQKHLCPTVSSRTAVKIYSVRLLSRNFSLLSLRQGGLKPASELLQEVREITVSRLWMKCGIRNVRGEPGPCVLQTSINWSILPSLLIQSTYTCWAWCELTSQKIKIWVRVGLQRASNYVRSNQW